MLVGFSTGFCRSQDWPKRTAWRDGTVLCSIHDSPCTRSWLAATIPPRLRDPRPNSSAAIWRALGFLLMRAHDLQCKFLTSKSVSKSTSSSHVRDLALRTLGSDNSDDAVESQGCLLFTYFMGETYMSFEGSSMFLVIVSNVSRHLWNHLTS